MALAYTFKGGMHVREYKGTVKCAVERVSAPKTVSIPLAQHIGVPCKPVVAVGDRVTYGQLIGDIESGLGCPVHASVSGTVIEIKTVINSVGTPIEHVVIENDYEYKRGEELKPFPKPLSEATSEEIVDVARRAGISGMGGATFPTYAKLAGAIGKADTLIINCAECEPFITANHRLMVEQPEVVVRGAEIMRHALGLKDAYLAVEDNKPDAIIALKNYILQKALPLKVMVMKTKYPQGDERQIMYALFKKELAPGKLPADMGCVIFNAETCAAMERAFYNGTPLVKRIVTVDGDCVKEPKNIFAHIGTSFSDLVEYCGGLKKVPHKIVNGGPMMGNAQWNVNGVVTKGTSAVLVFSEDFDKQTALPETACIRCGKCVKNCPMHLMPNYLALYSRKLNFKDAEAYGAMSCVECGTCSYNCPAQIPIVQYIRNAKAEIRAEAARQRAKQTSEKK